MNAGVLLYCRPLDYLKAWIELDTDRLLALDPAADVSAIERALAAVVRVCESDPGAGQAGLQDIGRRFGWLTAPRSTVVQSGPVHTGLTTDPGRRGRGCWLARRRAHVRPGRSAVQRRALATSLAT